MAPIENFNELQLNQAQAAELLGINRRNLTREGSEAPRNDDGSYDPKTLVDWYVKQINNGVPEEIEKEKLRKLRRENDTAESQLIDIKSLRPHCIHLQDSLRELGDKLARKRNLTGKQAQAMLNKTLISVEAHIANIAKSNS